MVNQATDATRQGYGNARYLVADFIDKPVECWLVKVMKDGATYDDMG